MGAVFAVCLLSAIRRMARPKFGDVDPPGRSRVRCAFLSGMGIGLRTLSLGSDGSSYRSAHRTSPSNRAWAVGIAGRVAEVGFEMRIGIVGSGKIGTTLAQLLLPAGHEVRIANR